jgi:hypothetical protein
VGSALLRALLIERDDTKGDSASRNAGDGAPAPEPYH